MYHHFAGKEALFRAVHAEVEAEAQARAVAARIRTGRPIEQIVAMVNGYLDAALDEEIRRITLVDGPALLGLEPDVPGRAAATRAVRAFIVAAIKRGEIVDVDPDVLTAAHRGPRVAGRPAHRARRRPGRDAGALGRVDADAPRPRP